MDPVGSLDQCDVLLPPQAQKPVRVSLERPLKQPTLLVLSPANLSWPTATMGRHRPPFRGPGPNLPATAFSVISTTA